MATLRKLDSNKKSTLNRIRYLCCSGHSAITLAPLFFKYLNQLIPHDLHAFALTSASAVPYMYYHSGLDQRFIDLLQHEVEIFLDPKTEGHMRWLDTPTLPKSGNLLRPDEQYFQSNNYQIMVRGSGVHHTLDLRLEQSNKPSGGVSLFRGVGSSFSEQDSYFLSQVGQYIEYALQHQTTLRNEFNFDVEQAMLILDPNSEVIMMTDSVKDLLNLLAIHYDFWEPNKALPKICYQVINELKYGVQLPQTRIDIPNGILNIRAEWMFSPLQQDRCIALHLKHELPRSLFIWTKLENADLSPQQCQVAYLLVTGNSKQDIMHKLEISPAVLKDCIKAIYLTFHVHSLAELIDYASRWSLKY
ncbi:hypothetical protein HYG93_10985 [Acinetobacter sp. SwsAc6]|uniref:helix-turn-helix transcriptional regulator n=1 Tax=Acinetobacter TaxID=469 RepID=UPI000D134404|nr:MULTISPECIES: LuxR C-terminal-related transcriptional regulator [Acinetobacter]NWK74793.1 hypothetical protein [Acinetobacter sp. SwsAc6]QCO21387.1 hypothetical protein C9E88_007605 [Acinetobacter cumulans]RFS29583.1 hypothetical protein DYI81_11760 [Acinetobacter sp. SWAC5]